jgi:hypothetical protein
MALLYHTSRVTLQSKEVTIRPLENDEDYVVAISFPREEEDEDAVTELLLTEGEVREAYDLLFNK